MDNNKSWFQRAKTNLQNYLEQHECVDGVRFLSEYLEENWPDELDESVNEEQFEAYVNENLDDFETWLVESQSGVEIHNDYTWGKLTSVIHSTDTANSYSLTSGQKALIQKKYADLEKADFPELLRVRDLLHKQNSFNNAAKIALKAAKIGDQNTDIDASQRAQAWEQLALLNIELDDYDNAYKNFEKAGEISINSGDSLVAAQYYEKSADNYLDDDWKLKHRLLRKARVLYADAGVNDSASNLYVQESNIKVENSTGGSKFFGRFYCVLSNYGESPWRVLGWISVLIILCAFAYWLTDINTPGVGIYQCNLSTEQANYICNEMEADRAHPLTHLYFSVVTFTTLGYGDYSPTEGCARLVAAIQAFLGLILSSLFIATFLRKFSR